MPRQGLQSDDRATAVAEDEGAVDAVVVEDRDDIDRLSPHSDGRLLRLGLQAAARVATPIECDHRVPGRQQGHHVLVHGGVASPAGDQDQGVRSAKDSIAWLNDHLKQS